MHSKVNETSGIDEELVENKEDCLQLLESLKCSICLEIIKNPYECDKCEAIYCFECWELMKIRGQNCVYHCVSKVIKARKFIFDMLGKIRFKCLDCKINNIPYNTYLNHMQICKLNSKLMNLDESNKFLKEYSDRIADLEKSIEEEKSCTRVTQSINAIDLLTDKDKLRTKYITTILLPNQKKELYTAVSEGNLNTFQILIEQKGYCILEEISAPNFFWTSFHYAMHYGKIDIINYIVDFYKKKNQLDEVMRLESNDGRCPLLCLLKSNSLSSGSKKNYLEWIFAKNKFAISLSMSREMKNRDLDYMIEKFKLKTYDKPEDK